MSIPRPQSPPNRSVSEIKAAFEARAAAAQQTLQQRTPPKTADTANMASPKRSSFLPKVSPPSIDAILDVVPSKLRPRWIGHKPAPRPVTPGVEAMKIPVCIEFASPGLKPPVYVGTSLSDPQWAPLEMEHFTRPDGKFTFRKFFAVEEGEYQYKLRLGPGDWWVCDDTQPQVDDGSGNKNNLVVVKHAAANHLAPPTPSAHEAATADKVESAHKVPLVPHEDHSPETKVPSIPVPEIKEHSDLESATHAPLLPHEVHTPEVKGNPDQHTTPDPPTHAPLMEHEDLSPKKDHSTPPPTEDIAGPLHCETHSPLFAHECTTPTSTSSRCDDHSRDSASPRDVMRGINKPGSPIPDEADPNDPSLVKFPTDHKGIMEHLEHTHKTLPADETLDHGSVSAPSPTSSHSSSPIPLPSVKEGEEEEDDDHLAPESDVPKLQIFEADRLANPITPPLTPKDVFDDMQKEFTGGFSDKAKAIADQIPDHAKESAKSVFFLVLGTAVALAATVISIWYIKSKSPLDHMLD
ncbi:uncharacterized protein RCC_10629 [Ramularia collo-cygni]|uniref:AMP-activated protein kinase glycogen-binding domain-containing protein n=1 Tax=Ramularia collo-cygni TaxID=112498 RepID=A0A2D3VK88_9PEZI|nr:uncharacterized protein RCC_10629 [Ramularia collo-cygni]CZT24901.1 uncharacterized protein RCC_10629 [Ramularia collo-cygni]